MKAMLYRAFRDEYQTRGFLVIFEPDYGIIYKAVTLELPWLENQRNISCIPYGNYLVKPRFSEKYEWHYEIQDVPDRSLILFHWGNYKKDTKGCILVGDNFVDIDGDGHIDVTDSRAKFKEMVMLIGQKDFRLEIRDEV